MTNIQGFVGDMTKIHVFLSDMTNIPGFMGNQEGNFLTTTVSR